jgi:hypothetical protein
METRKPIALPSIAVQIIQQTNFQNDGISIPARQCEKKSWDNVPIGTASLVFILFFPTGQE